MRTLKPGTFSLGVLSTALVATLALACRQVDSPSTSDEWADATAVRMQMNSELSNLTTGVAAATRSYTHSVTVPIVQFGNAQSNGATRLPGGRFATVHHFRYKGRTFSIAAIYSHDGRPPERIYAFEEGRIRLIDEPDYRPRSTGFVRGPKGHTLVFDTTGRPVALHSVRSADVAARTDASPTVQALSAFARDALLPLLPAPLHAEEESGGCGLEWLAYAAAGWAVSAATAELIAAAELCKDTTLTCAVLADATMKLSATVAAWSIALDKLAACLEKNKKTTSTGTAGGSTGGGATSSSDDATMTAIAQAVDQFIADSIANGTFICNADMSDCFFY